MNDFSLLSAFIKKKTEQICKRIDAYVRRVAISIDQHVVLATPVDTGRARSNWITTINEASYEEIDPYAPGKKLGLSEVENAMAAINQGMEVIQQFKMGNVIYITNNVPYMTFLNNNGHSPQAPPGFIQSAILEGILAIKGAKLVS